MGNKPNTCAPLVAAAAVSVLLLSACVGPFEPDDGFFPGEHSREISFSGYRGTPESLPDNMFVTATNSAGDEIGPDFAPFSGVHTFQQETLDPNDSFDGFGAFTSGDGRYSFGIREHGDLDVQDSRLFYAYTNTSGTTITGFTVSYNVEVWYLGQRNNRIRLKYNDSATGYASLASIASTNNPLSGFLSGGLSLDGRSPQHSKRITATFALQSLLDDAGNRAGINRLQHGDTGYLRWQYSNGVVVGGDLRSALAISDIRVTPIFAP